MSLKKLFCSAMAAVAMCGVAMAEEVAVPSNANDCPVNVSLSLDLASRYMSKGLIVNPRTMLFGDAVVSFKADENFSVYGELFGAFDLNAWNQEVGPRGYYNHNNRFEEVDMVLGVTYKIDEIEAINSLTIDLNYAYWYYAHCSGWTTYAQKQEWALNLTTGLPFNPGIKTMVDFEYSLVYFDLYASYAIEGKDYSDKLAAWTLYTKGELFICNSHAAKRFAKPTAEPGWYRSGLSFTTFVWTLGVDYKINDYLTVGPYAQLSFAIDHFVRESWQNDGVSGNGVNNKIGIALNASF